MGPFGLLCCAYVVQDSGLAAPMRGSGGWEVMAVTQRRRGFGRVRLERSGRFSAGYVGPDLRLHRAAETFPTRMDAEGWLAVERRLIDLDQWVPPVKRRPVYAEPEPDPRELTVGSYATSWLADRCERDPRDPQALRPSSVKDYQLLLANHIIPGLGRIPLSELKAPRSKPGTASSVPAAPPGRERRRTACCGRS